MLAMVRRCAPLLRWSWTALSQRRRMRIWGSVAMPRPTTRAPLSKISPPFRREVSRRRRKADPVPVRSPLAKLLRPRRRRSPRPLPAARRNRRRQQQQQRGRRAHPKIRPPRRRRRASSRRCSARARRRISPAVVLHLRHRRRAAGRACSPPRARTLVSSAWTATRGASRYPARVQMLNCSVQARRRRSTRRNRRRKNGSENR
mmetsp:Transcript_4045/g.9512  ORF Transcript_4045/g.9512 Transcript_4045/m.9512 type:complete len:203 (+) Transcript_4045:505-1113(+)